MHREKGLCLSVIVDDIKLAGEKEDNNPMWKVLNKQVELRKPTSVLDHVYLECTQRHCETRKQLVDNHSTMFEIQDFRRSNGKTTKLGKSECFYAVLRHGRSCHEMCGTILRIGEKKSNEQVNKVSTPCIDDHQFIEEELKSVVELSEICSQIVLKCLFSGTNWKTGYSMVSQQIGTCDHKMTRACDKRLARLISYIHCTSEYKQYCHVGNTAQQCRLGLFQDSNIASDLED